MSTRSCALADIRKARGLTQVELAKRVGLTQPALWKLEHGKHAPKGLVSALAIAAVLRVKVTDIWPICPKPQTILRRQQAVTKGAGRLRKAPENQGIAKG